MEKAVLLFASALAVPAAFGTLLGRYDKYADAPEPVRR
jgi:hypothetical protein